MKLLISILSLIRFIYIIATVGPNDDYQLELVQVIFRHGDRIPDELEIYKTDPYAEKFKSYGYGQLTKIGKQREYKIGKKLRELYGNFLGDYNINDVYAYSTDINRTKMSLKLVLTGLYPPSPNTSYSDDIELSSIPTHYDPFGLNFLSVYSCEHYHKLFWKIQHSAEIQSKFKKYRGFYEYVRYKTGIKFFTPYSITVIYSNIRAVKSLGLPLPDWCTEKHFKILEEIAAITFRSLTQTEEMKRSMGGLLIEKFLDNIEEQDHSANRKKIYLYGAHDLTVASFTNVHNFTGIPDIPDYGSAIIFEKLRGKDKRVYIRMYLWTGVGETLIPLKLNNRIETTYLLSDYKNIVKSLLPGNFARQCLRLSAVRHLMDTSLQLQSAHLFSASTS